MKSTLLLPICVAAAAVVAVSAPTHAGVILTGNSSIPGSPVVNTSSATATNNEGGFRPGNSTRQTFTVDTAFQLDAILLEYQAATAADFEGTFNLNIYQQANVQNTTLGPLLLSVPVTLTTASRTAANFTTSNSVSSILKFDLTGADEINLAAGGYALEFNASALAANTTPFFAIRNNFTTGTTPTNPATYAGGRLDGSANLDAVVFLTAVPEPSSLLCLLMGVTGLVSRRRR